MSLTEATQRLDAVARELAAIREIQRKLRKEAGWQESEDQEKLCWQGLRKPETDS